MTDTKSESPTDVRCSAWLGVKVAHLLNVWMITHPASSRLRTLKAGMARSAWRLWLQLRAFRRAQTQQRNVPLRRSVLLLLDPAAYMLWPHPVNWPKLTPMQRIARCWVKIVAASEANQTRREDRIGHPTPAQIDRVMPYADWTPNVKDEPRPRPA